MITWLKEYGYPDEKINSYLNNKRHIFSDEECISYNDIEKYIEEHYYPNKIIIWL